MVSLKSAHLYRRVPTDLSKATHTGGAVSLVAIGTILTLLMSNLRNFYAVNVERTMEIDQVYDESMVVSFNLTLPRLPCAVTSLDLTDALGTSIHNVTRGLTKMRIDEHSDEKLLSHTDMRWMRVDPVPALRGQELAGHLLSCRAPRREDPCQHLRPVSPCCCERRLQSCPHDLRLQRLHTSA